MNTIILISLIIVVFTIVAFSSVHYIRKAGRRKAAIQKRKDKFKKQVELKTEGEQDAGKWKFDATPEYPAFRCVARNEENAVRKYKNFISDCNTARRNKETKVYFNDLDGSRRYMNLPVIQFKN